MNLYYNKTNISKLKIILREYFCTFLKKMLVMSALNLIFIAFFCIIEQLIRSLLITNLLDYILNVIYLFYVLYLSIQH